MCVYASFCMCLIKLFYMLHKTCVENTDSFRIMCNAAFLLKGLQVEKKKKVKNNPKNQEKFL